MCNANYPKLTCRICAKNVHDKDKTVQCDICEFWIHIKCNNLNYLDYRYLQNCDESWYCIECCSTIFPFNSLSSSKSFLACCSGSDSNFIQLKELENDNNSSLLLKPSPNLELSVNQFNNENSNDPAQFGVNFKCLPWRRNMKNFKNGCGSMVQGQVFLFNFYIQKLLNPLQNCVTHLKKIIFSATIIL